MGVIRPFREKDGNRGILSDRGHDGYTATRIASFNVLTSNSGGGDSDNVLEVGNNMNWLRSDALIVPGGSILKQVTFVTALGAANNKTPTIEMNIRDLVGVQPGAWKNIGPHLNSHEDATDAEEVPALTGSKEFFSNRSNPELLRSKPHNREVQIQFKTYAAGDYRSYTDTADNCFVILDFINL